MRTLSDLVFHVRDRWGGRSPLTTIRRGGRLESCSTGELVDAVHSLALALEERGLEKGQRVAILGENCPEWHFVDLACQLLGAVTVPLPPSLPLAQVAFLLRNSASRWCFVAGRRRSSALGELAAGLTSPLERVILDQEVAGEGELSVTRLLGEGHALKAERPSLDRFRGRVGEEDLASILYTGGTTGEPKGVMLTHRNFVSNLLGCAEIFPLGPEDVAVSFLPLSHAFERTVAHLYLHRGVTVHYCPRIEQVPACLEEVRPTVLASVPRLYERAFIRIRMELERAGAVERRLFDWAIAVGARHHEARQRGLVGPLLALKAALARRTVGRRFNRRFGGRLRWAISGGAALDRRVAELFRAGGLPIYQGYGMAETCAVITANHPGEHRPGSVGRPLAGVDLRLADDGEILVRGPAVMRGYWEDPEATRRVFDAEGWFRTGDVGRLDGEGFLWITGRKREMIVTSAGKGIAPRPIERRLTANGYVAQAVVVGEGYPYPTALLVPDFEALRSRFGDLAPAELAAHPVVRDEVERIVARANERLAEHHRLRRWTLLDRELSVERGELTPTGKVRRTEVMRRYGPLVDAMYPGSGKV